MEYDDPLRQRARQAIASGRLPARRPVRSWAGKGSGTSCLLCAQAITADDIELELELDFGEAAPSTPPRSCRVHSRCFAAWELECRQLAAGN